jgi:hypothetical protein
MGVTIGPYRAFLAVAAYGKNGEWLDCEDVHLAHVPFGTSRDCEKAHKWGRTDSYRARAHIARC